MNLTVASDAEILSALKQIARAGEGGVIRVAPGQYGTLMIRTGWQQPFEFAREVTVTSLDPANPASFRGAYITSTRNVTLRALDFDNRRRFSNGRGRDPKTGAIQYYAMIRCDGSKRFKVRRCRLRGSRIDIPGHPQNGFGSGFGVHTIGCDGVEVSECRLTNLDKAFAITKTKNLRLLNNYVPDNRSDALFMAECSNFVVERNEFAGVDPAPRDHMDLLQGDYLNDGIICDNVFDSGYQFRWSQGLFGGNNRNVVIENNIVLTRAWNAVRFNAEKSRLLRNLVLPLPFAPGRPNDPSYPLFRFTGADSIAAGNISTHFEGDLKIGNVLLQMSNLMGPNYCRFVTAQDEPPGLGFVRIGGMMVSRTAFGRGTIDLQRFDFLRRKLITFGG